MFSSVNHKLLALVYQTRRKEGLKVPHTMPCDELNKLFQGLSVEDSSTGKKYQIKEFVKYWYNGWCIIAQMEELCNDGFRRIVNVIWQKHMSEALSDCDEMRADFTPLM